MEGPLVTLSARIEEVRGVRPVALSWHLPELRLARDPWAGLGGFLPVPQRVARAPALPDRAGGPDSSFRRRRATHEKSGGFGAQRPMEAYRFALSKSRVQYGGLGQASLRHFFLMVHTDGFMITLI